MAQSQRDAVILLAGLQREDIGESVDLAAARLVAALDSEAKTVAARFLIENAHDEDYGQQTDGHKTRVVTVSRQDPGGSAPTPLVDVYGLDYRQTLLGDTQARRPVQHLLSTFWILGANSRTLLFSVGRQSKRSADKWQVRLGWFFYLILFAYVAMLLGAALGTLASLGTPSPGQPGTSDQSVVALTSWLAIRLTPATIVMQTVVVWVTAIGLFLSVDLKELASKTGLGITAASQYLTLDWRRKSLEAQFAALLNHIGEREDVQYRRVHIVGYSFGSIIAVDALFPYEQSAAVFRQVHTFVTIGCPFDFIRTYWPAYFDGRTQLPDVPARWINIYAAADVLGSDFMDQPPQRPWLPGGRRQPRPPVPSGIAIGDGATIRRPDVNERYGRSTTLEEYSIWDKLGFLGFSMHRQYWEGTSPGCYRIIVRALYGDDAALE
jgi:hypothetical protein